ncbi:hypothetical protein GW916_14595 [bacterium]|nr:hypothetical protein [bacterium]
MAQNLLIPPGRSQTITCPEGKTPLVKTGDLLPNAKEPNIFVIQVDGQSILLGPIKVGVHELPALCQGLDQTWTVEIIPPNPEKLKKEFSPSAPFELGYPSWIWVALALGILAIIGIIAGVFQIRKNKDRIKAFGRNVRIRKNPIQRMEAFLVQAERDKVDEGNDSKTAGFLYGDGIKHLRPLIQKLYQFKAPGATRKEFIALLKQNVARQPSLMNPQQIAQLESLFMQSSQVDYSDAKPAPHLRAAFLRQLKEFSSLFINKINIQLAAEANKPKPSKLRKVLKKK